MAVFLLLVFAALLFVNPPQSDKLWYRAESHRRSLRKWFAKQP